MRHALTGLIDGGAHQLRQASRIQHMHEDDDIPCLMIDDWDATQLAPGIGRILGILQMLLCHSSSSVSIPTLSSSWAVMEASQAYQC